MRPIIAALVLVSCTTVPAFPSAGTAPDASVALDAHVDSITTTPDAGPLLWSGANLVLATAYCGLGVRCGTGDYAFLYGSGSAALAACVQTLDDSLCYGEWEGVEMCESAYPTERDQNLAACPGDSAAVDCPDGDLNWVLSCNLAAPWAQGA
jgi:hypothetical protein